MSKERARKRAEERARKRAPKSHGDSDASTEQVVKRQPDRKVRQRSAREQRRQRRIWIIAIAWLLANGLIFLLADTWNVRWLGLTITTILIPLVVWLVWDPEGRVNL
jgi:fatty acid desaturase